MPTSQPNIPKPGTIEYYEGAIRFSLRIENKFGLISKIILCTISVVAISSAASLLFAMYIHFDLDSALNIRSQHESNIYTAFIFLFFFPTWTIGCLWCIVVFTRLYAEKKLKHLKHS